MTTKKKRKKVETMPDYFAEFDTADKPYYRRDEQFIHAMIRPFGRIIATCAEETANRVLDNYLKTKGDSISKSQAEREFGKKWMADHIKAYGREIYISGLWNPETGAMNNKKVFSRKQLSEIRQKETTIEAVYEFSRLCFGYVREKKKRNRKEKVNEQEKL